MTKLVESRKKSKIGSQNMHQQTNEAVENGNGRVRLERFVKSLKDAMTKAIRCMTDSSHLL